MARMAVALKGRIGHGAAAAREVVRLSAVAGVTQKNSTKRLFLPISIQPCVILGYALVLYPPYVLLTPAVAKYSRRKISVRLPLLKSLLPLKMFDGLISKTSGLDQFKA